MEERGYTLGRLLGLFVKSCATLDKRITLTVNKWSNGTGHHLNHVCGYRLPAYEDVHNRYLPHRTDKEKRLAPTISHYFFNLVPQGFDWKDVTVASESDLPIVARSIERICTLYSFPFLDRFSTAEAILEGFRGERDTWAVQDPILRYRLLLLDAVLKRDPSCFGRWLDETMRFCGSRTDGQAVGLLDLARSLKKDYF
jgi:hypothetical protein